MNRVKYEQIDVQSIEHRPLHFGDRGEFTFDNIVEEFDVSGERITETVLFFKYEDTLRGLRVAVSYDGHPDAEDEHDTSIIELPFIDPDAILGVLTLPSEELLRFSKELDT